MARKATHFASTSSSSAFSASSRPVSALVLPSTFVSTGASGARERVARGMAVLSSSKCFPICEIEGDRPLERTSQPPLLDGPRCTGAKRSRTGSEGTSGREGDRWRPRRDGTKRGGRVGEVIGESWGEGNAAGRGSSRTSSTGRVFGSLLFLPSNSVPLPPEGPLGVPSSPSASVRFLCEDRSSTARFGNATRIDPRKRTEGKKPNRAGLEAWRLGSMADYGRRLAGKLTADLVLESPQGLNPVGDYELDLRRNKLSVIENLGATRDQFESIDFSDNEIMRLDGFPRLLKMEQLLFNRNRIYKIERRIGGEEWKTN
eukprot:scaffold2858_cov659-Pavlova_lutheri.AAC.119